VRLCAALVWIGEAGNCVAIERESFPSAVAPSPLVSMATLRCHGGWTRWAAPPHRGHATGGQGLAQVRVRTHSLWERVRVHGLVDCAKQRRARSSLVACLDFRCSWLRGSDADRGDAAAPTTLSWFAASPNYWVVDRPRVLVASAGVTITTARDFL